MYKLNQVRRGTTAASLLIWFAGLALPVAAQNQSQYSSIQLRDSVPGKQVEHRRFLTTAWLKSAEHGVSNGSLHGALVLRVAGGAAAPSDYDHATILYPVKTPNLAVTPREVMDARAKAAGFADRTAYQAALRGVSTPVRQGYSVMQASLGTVPKGSFLRVAQWEVPAHHRDAVRDYIREYTIPMNAARIKQGSILGWSLVTPAVVSAEEAGWAQTSVTVLKDGESAFVGPGQGTMTEERFKALLPGKSYADYIRSTEAVNSMRKRVRTRLYEVIATVGNVPNTGAR